MRKSLSRINTMLLLALLLLVSQNEIQGQDDWYSKQLNARIGSLDSTNTLVEYTQHSVFFYRMWETNPADWRPAYYYVYTSLRCAEDPHSSNKPELFASTQEFFNKQGKKFSALPEFNILEAKLNLLQYQHDNDSLTIARSAYLLKKVFNTDKQNIRAQLVLAQYYLVKYAGTDYGTQKAAECIQLALEQPYKKPEDELLPYAWGKRDIEQMALSLNLQVH